MKLPARQASPYHHVFNLMRRIIALHVSYYLLVYKIIYITCCSIAFCGTSEYKSGLQHRIISENHEDFVSIKKALPACAEVQYWDRFFGNYHIMTFVDPKWSPEPADSC